MRALLLALTLLPLTAQAELRLLATGESSPFVVADVSSSAPPGGPALGGGLGLAWRLDPELELGGGVEWSGELDTRGRALHLLRVPAQITWVAPVADAATLLFTAELGYAAGFARDAGARLTVGGPTAGLLLGAAFPLADRLELTVHSGLRATALGGHDGPTSGLQLVMPFRAGLRWLI
ncbi:MAG: hypothetical protein H6706_16090 [Myxococcales bacterium]|nr:hypothetical protein [Myxococcales bacterium]